MASRVLWLACTVQARPMLWVTPLMAADSLCSYLPRSWLPAPRLLFRVLCDPSRPPFPFPPVLRISFDKGGPVLRSAFDEGGSPPPLSHVSHISRLLLPAFPRSYLFRAISYSFPPGYGRIDLS